VRARRTVAAVVVALLASAGLHAAFGPRYGGELRLGFVGRPPERLLRAMSHETLVRESDGGLVAPALACSWNAGEDGRVWSLTLCGNRTFHDGTAVTGERVVASLRRFLDGPSPAARVLQARLAEDAPAVAAPGTDLVTLRFRTPASAFDLLPLASSAAAIVSERDAGAGPFVPTIASGDDRVYTPFVGHVRGRPFVDRVRLRLFASEAALRAEWKRGRLHLASGGGDLALAPAVLLLVLDPRSPAFAAPRA
jgi:ABC-type transport system substrate-binding protein